MTWDRRWVRVGPTRAGCVGDQINRLPWVRAGVGITLKIVGTHWWTIQIVPRVRANTCGTRISRITSIFAMNNADLSGAKSLSIILKSHCVLTSKNSKLHQIQEIICHIILLQSALLCCMTEYTFYTGEWLVRLL